MTDRDYLLAIQRCSFYCRFKRTFYWSVTKVALAKFDSTRISIRNFIVIAWYGAASTLIFLCSYCWKTMPHRYRYLSVEFLRHIVREVGYSEHLSCLFCFCISHFLRQSRLEWLLLRVSTAISWFLCDPGKKLLAGVLLMKVIAKRSEVSASTNALWLRSKRSGRFVNANATSLL